MNSELLKISEKLKHKSIGLKETLSLLDMAFGVNYRRIEKRKLFFPKKIFENLDELINKTVHGAKIKHLTPRKGRNPFHTFEIHTEKKELLGYLNMVYFRNPIPCYYLVYVEILEPFRNRGLGTMILKSFRKFVEVKGAIGLLDNIIPPEDPTYQIYTKLGWKNIREFISESIISTPGNYMIFTPHSINIFQLKEKLIRLLIRVSKKRQLIEMYENEAMVKRTISEFQKIYDTLTNIFEKEILLENPPQLPRFLFTKFVTKLLGFRRRISKLIGYTGGESLEQIMISEKVKDLQILSYSLWGENNTEAVFLGKEEIIDALPEELIKNPTDYIESLPLYKRPFLNSWLNRRGGTALSNIKIRDLLELGFDPTRLKEFYLNGIYYIFERVSPLFLSSIEKRKNLFETIDGEALKLKIQNTSVLTNPPLVIIIDKGNIYVLRKKLKAIHIEEALEQLRNIPYLKEMNRKIGIDRIIIGTTNEIKKWLIKRFGNNFLEELEDITFFIPWDIEKNMPMLNIDITKVYMDKIWIS